MFNKSEIKIGQVLVLGLVIIFVMSMGVWLYNKGQNISANSNPKTSHVCLDNSCSYRKQCDDKTLVFYIQGGSRDEREIKNRIPNSNECL